MLRIIWRGAWSDLLLRGKYVCAHFSLDRASAERDVKLSCCRVDHVAQPLRIARRDLVTQRRPLADADGCISLWSPG
ncbi:MAG: hypothetical protein GIW99_00465 [Candidatus Eremiobacteraeota bacterium]|nr:hypothetical protein [Candidatus Eremiobacteraeota bacterium]MBC5826159.1 hypothetical protein [Candidatus Eremiobacteraeota bacterium]